MGLFDKFKSKRQETEEELYDRLLSTPTDDPGYENLTKAVDAVNKGKSDKKGVIIAAIISGLFGLVGIVAGKEIEERGLNRRHEYSYIHDETIVSTDAGKQSVRDGLRKR